MTESIFASFPLTSLSRCDNKCCCDVHRTSKCAMWKSGTKVTLSQRGSSVIFSVTTPPLLQNIARTWLVCWVYWIL